MQARSGYSRTSPEPDAFFENAMEWALCQAYRYGTTITIDPKALLELQLNNNEGCNGNVYTTCQLLVAYIKKYHPDNNTSVKVSNETCCIKYSRIYHRNCGAVISCTEDGYVKITPMRSPMYEGTGPMLMHEVECAREITQLEEEIESTNENAQSGEEEEDENNFRRHIVGVGAADAHMIRLDTSILTANDCLQRLDEHLRSCFSEVKIASGGELSGTVGEKIAICTNITPAQALSQMQLPPLPSNGKGDARLCFHISQVDETTISFSYFYHDNYHALEVKPSLKMLGKR